MQIDENKCTGCGTCINACPTQAITVSDNLATIDQDLCVECANCAAVCTAGAISGAVPALKEPAKGGERMFYGYGRGFGFRGTSPSWPYVGRGRGGLPRCWHPGLYAGGTAYAAPWATAYPPSPAPENELSFLKNQADIMKHDMTEIDRRIQELEKKEQKTGTP